MKKLLALLAASAATSLMAYEANLNLDWRFQKGGNSHRGLDAALNANAVEGAQVYDVDFDDSAWQLVSTPHCVNAHDSYDERTSYKGERSFYRGWMFYRKTFQVPKGKHFFLTIDTVRQSLYVYANGQMAGYYEAGTAPTGYDLTPYVKSGEAAQITIVTENMAANGTDIHSSESLDKPGDWEGSDFQWYGSDFNPVQGGLIGNVTLEVKENDAYITLPFVNCLKTTGVYLWADDFDFAKGSATIHCEAQVFDRGLRDAKPEELAFTIDGKTYRGGAAKVTGLTFWSPDTPHLYDVKVSFSGNAREGASDTVTIRTGFRKVEFVKGKLLLVNGKETWLPGYAQRATDSWAAIGFAPAWLQDYDAALIRESGANFVRWKHITPKPAPIRAFDKYGVVSVCPAGDKEIDAKGRQWEQRVEAMEAAIVYFRNSPSIFFWEAGNAAISFVHMIEMRHLKEKYDPHGYRFMGCRSIAKPEVIAESEYVGTMIHRQDIAALEAMKQVGKALPIIEGEFCREEAPRRLWDRFSPPDYDFVGKFSPAPNEKREGLNTFDLTEEELALANAGTVDGYGYFWGNRANGKLDGGYVGAAELCWSDCNQRGRQASTENCRMSGRVDAVRIPKESFYVHQVMFSQVPKIKVLGHWNYPKFTNGSYWYREKENNGKEIACTGERKQRDPTHKTVYVIASLQVDHVRLFVNGKWKAKATKAEHLFDFAFPNIDVTLSGRIEAVGYDKDDKEICRDSVYTVGKAARLEMSSKTGPKGFLADGSDIAMVDLRLVDAKGRTLPLATNRVVFTMAFNGAPVDIGNVGTENQNNTLPTFMGGWNSGVFGKRSPVGRDFVNFECGLARVFVKSGRVPGTVMLSARADNGMTAQVVLETKSVSEQGGIAAEGPQAEPINRSDYTVANPVKPVRDLGKDVNSVDYKVYVNGKEVVFSTRSGGAFKPDGKTGVVGPYNPVLAAIKKAGAMIETSVSPKVIDRKLRAFTPSAQGYDIQVTIPGGRVQKIDAVSGMTDIFEDKGKGRSHTNFTMVEKDKMLVGELPPLLSYIPGVVVRRDGTRHFLIIEVKK